MQHAQQYGSRFGYSPDAPANLRAQRQQEDDQEQQRRNAEVRNPEPESWWSRAKSKMGF